MIRRYEYLFLKQHAVQVRVSMVAFVWHYLMESIIAAHAQLDTRAIDVKVLLLVRFL